MPNFLKVAFIASALKPVLTRILTASGKTPLSIKRNRYLSTLKGNSGIARRYRASLMSKYGWRHSIGEPDHAASSISNNQGQ